MKRRTGFTLIELVIVVLIIGIIAAIAVPKVLNISNTASDNSARQSLGVLRDGIDQYFANTSSYPAATDTATFKAAMSPFLRGAFPVSPVCGGTANGNVTISTGTASLSGTGNGTTGWKYNSTTGEIIINSHSNAQNGLPYDTF